MQSTAWSNHVHQTVSHTSGQALRQDMAQAWMWSARDISFVTHVKRLVLSEASTHGIRPNLDYSN
jgi:hypothetical protein